MTNAVMHARTELHPGISGDATTLLFTVADGHPNPPSETRTAVPDFGWRRRDDGDGKVVWFTLTIPPTDETGPQGRALAGCGRG